MKRITAGVALLIAVILVAGAVFAAGGNKSSTTHIVAVISENIEMEVKSALVVEAKRMEIIIPLAEKVSIYPGQTIAKGEITIENVSPIAQAAHIYARPIQIDEIWPAFEVFEVNVRVNNVDHWPWELIVMAPGEKVDVKFTIKVGYGSPASTFRGVELMVETIPPPSEDSG